MIFRRASLGLVTLLGLLAACLPQRSAPPAQPAPAYGGYPPPAYGNYPPPYYPPPASSPPQPTAPAPAPTQPQPAPTQQRPAAPADPLSVLLGQLLTSGPPPIALPPGWPQLPGWPQAPTQPTPPQPHAQPGGLPPIGARALDLANTINAYRQQQGLPPIPVTRALTFVAETHVRDLAASPKRSGCNGHSWSEGGRWSACCYTPDHAQARCMWSKPSELTHYTSAGFEIEIGQPGEGAGYVLDSQRALELWKGSALHHDVILNRATWQSNPWRAMGAGIIDSHAAVWFSREVDPAP